MLPFASNATYRFFHSPEPSAEWSEYLRGLGFDALALPVGTPPKVIAEWQALGWGTIADDRSDRDFPVALAHLFTAAEKDEQYTAIYREFTGATFDPTAAAPTGLIGHAPLVGTADEPAKRFHRAAEQRTERTPAAILPGLTDETLTADMRARLLAAVGDPAGWRQRVLRWKEYAGDVKPVLAAADRPSPQAEYGLYQRLLAAWPALPPDFPEEPGLLERVCTAAAAGIPELKALATALFTSHEGRFFRQAFIPFANALVERGATLALSALVLQCTSPGIPEIADGEEIWTPTPPAPPMPITERVRLLASADAPPAALIEPWRDSRLKLFVLRTLLGLRARVPALFGRSQYVSEKALGKFAGCCFAFARQYPGCVLLVAVPRQVPPMAYPPVGDAWEKTALEICGITKIHWTNVFTGAESTGPYIALSEAFAELPVAVFLAKSDGGAEVHPCP